jgi:hypothetical protein
MTLARVVTWPALNFSVVLEDTIGGQSLFGHDDGERRTVIPLFAPIRTADNGYRL